MADILNTAQQHKGDRMRFDPMPDAPPANTGSPARPTMTYSAVAAKPRHGPRIIAVSATASVCRVIGTPTAPTGIAGASVAAEMTPAKTATSARSVTVDWRR